MQTATLTIARRDHINPTALGTVRGKNFPLDVAVAIVLAAWFKEADRQRSLVLTDDVAYGYNGALVLFSQSQPTSTGWADVQYAIKFHGASGASYALQWVTEAGITMEAVSHHWAGNRLEAYAAPFEFFATFVVSRYDERGNWLHTVKREMNWRDAFYLFLAAVYKHADREQSIVWEGEAFLLKLERDGIKREVYAVLIDGEDEQNAAANCLEHHFEKFSPKAGFDRARYMSPARWVAPEVKPFDLLDFIVAFEGGELDEDEVIAGMIVLRDRGLLNTLQGFYGRTARDLGVI